uniref:Uncharacterized protein n=1 Tax=Romanomermis culicivorax TaxID=13658 RepID=A0A915HF57_ROMCU
MKHEPSKFKNSGRPNLHMIRRIKYFQMEKSRVESAMVTRKLWTQWLDKCCKKDNGLNSVVTGYIKKKL